MPITVNKKLMSELNAKARKKYRYNQKGKKFGMSDIVKIQELLQVLSKAETDAKAGNVVPIQEALDSLREEGAATMEEANSNPDTK